MAEPNALSGAPQEEKFALTTSRGFPSWLGRSAGALAFTTYQAGKLFLIGVKPDGRLSIFERTFARCMGLGVSPEAYATALRSAARASGAGSATDRWVKIQSVHVTAVGHFSTGGNITAWSAGRTLMYLQGFQHVEPTD